MNKGFTLIEVLVALSIVGIIGVMSFAGLITTVKNNDITISRIDLMSKIVMTDEILKRDLLHALDRIPRDERGESYGHSFYGLNPRFEGDLLAFSVHTGNNLTSKNGTIRFVRYTYEDESLKRIESNFVDKTEDTKEREQVLLKGVKNISIRFNQGNQWVEDWPLTEWTSNNGLPQVAEISYEVEGLGNVVRRYMLSFGDSL